MKLIDLFSPAGKLPSRQRQYEAVRAVAFGEGELSEIARRFGYKTNSLKTLVAQARTATRPLFPEVKPGPKGRRTAPETVERAVELRRRRKLSAEEIAEDLRNQGIVVSVRTVERTLRDAGFPKLRRRTNKERGVTKKGTLLCRRSGMIDLCGRGPFTVECRSAGLFFFVPYIIESGVLEAVQACPLPESSEIGGQQAALSMLALKLLGRERLSHSDAFESDAGLGLFAGLGVLPKASYMTSYSCRVSREDTLRFQEEVVRRFSASYPELYQGETINLDFHTIPHFGDESIMEKPWCGTRNKRIKGANTFVAQDGSSDCLVYSNADVPGKDAAREVRRFVDYWLGLKGVVKETLVFDSKLTTYPVLNELDKQGVKFITLRRRGRTLCERARSIPESEWQRLTLDIPKRKHKKVKAHERRTQLKGLERPLREVIVTDHGRAEPTFIVTNNDSMTLPVILTIYARRWHIENTLAELVHFFHLNALSSPLMIRIHFDMLWTIIAHTIYALLTRELKGFEKSRAPYVFRHFIDMPGRIVYNGSEFTVKIRKRAMTPLLRSVDKLSRETRIPWLDNRPLRFEWTA